MKKIINMVGLGEGKILEIESGLDIVQVVLFPHCPKRARQGSIFHLPFGYCFFLLLQFLFLSPVWLPRFTYTLLV